MRVRMGIGNGSLFARVLNVEKAKEPCPHCGSTSPKSASPLHRTVCLALSIGDKGTLATVENKVRRIETTRRIKALTKGKTYRPNRKPEPVIETLVDPKQQSFEVRLRQAGRPGSSREH
jgi:hypothetical protein